jgi:hypothetical protein
LFFAIFGRSGVFPTRHAMLTLRATTAHSERLPLLACPAIVRCPEPFGTVFPLAIPASPGFSKSGSGTLPSRAGMGGT